MALRAEGTPKVVVGSSCHGVQAAALGQARLLVERRLLQRHRRLALHPCSLGDFQLAVAGDHLLLQELRRPAGFPRLPLLPAEVHWSAQSVGRLGEGLRVVAVPAALAATR